MATLEDAAEQLVVRLKGLDSEIEESQHALEEMRGRVEETKRAVDQEWSHLTEAVSAFIANLREQQEQVVEETEEALAAVADGRGTLQETGAEARSEVADASADVQTIAEHASGLEPGVESLVADAGEAPARSLAERAKEVEDQLEEALQEACSFLRDEVTSALTELTEEVRERCRALQQRIVDEAAESLQAVFAEWEARVDQLEDYVSTQGFLASRSHARTVVQWALDECVTACGEHLSAITALVEEVTGPLRELSAALETAGDTLVACGGGMKEELLAAGEAAGGAVSALDAVKDLLAGYSFVGA